MTAPRVLTQAELALLALRGGDDLPTGGEPIVGSVLGPADTTGSATAWTALFNSLFTSRAGITFVPGSLNLQVSPFTWPTPWTVNIGSILWDFCPTIVQDQVIGLAFRANLQRPDLLEIVSPVHIRTALGCVEDGQSLALRVLKGTPLW
jgi:hypothetical protein